MKKKKIIIGGSCIAFILVVVLTVNILSFGLLNNVFTTFFSGFYTSLGSTMLDTNYYPTKYSNSNEVNAAERSFVEKVAGEGIVLLEQNEKSGIPYAKDTIFSIFSHSSVDMIYGGTGSGSIGGTKVTIKQAFEERGLKVNDKLWDFYLTGDGKNYTRGKGSHDFGEDEYYQINECPLNVITANSSLVSSFNGTVGVFVISRTGGEGRDVPRSMVEHAQSAEDKKKSYLELDSTELEIIDYLNQNFRDVIILVNSNNAIELGWVKDYEHINTVLSVPGTGTTGMYALAEILLGNVNPSGHLVDTYAYDFFSSPASENCDEVVCYVDGNAPTGGGSSSFDDGYNEYLYYTVYKEGIYVGYKYYETRYEDYILNQGNAGNYDYVSTVQYPFGYGLSRTNFEWSEFKIEWNEDKCTVSVTVRNEGNVAGKDVVQVYLQKPYTEYDKLYCVEKSAVELVGFAKTDLLQPNEEQTVKVEFDKKQFAAYDYKGAKTYILDDGDYYITAAVDAHAAINNVLKTKAPETAERLVASPAETIAGDTEFVAKYTVDNFDKTTYAKDGDTAITNQLDFASLAGVTYLTRNDWVGTYPTPYGEVSAVPSTYGNRVNGGTDDNPVNYSYKINITKEQYDAIRSTESGNPIDDGVYTQKAEYGSTATSLELIDLRGAEYDDPRWEQLLNQLTEKEMTEIINQSGYGTRKCSSIKKNKDNHSDGPGGFTAILGNNSEDGFGFMVSFMLAQTWNSDLAHEKGNLIGEESLLRSLKLCGWYGPGLNIHRTPFSGRNFEYYSEDSFLAGTFGAQEIIGAAEKGLKAFPKHFAFNDSESHRGDKTGEHGGGEWGVCTWLNEQAAREIYLRAFELAVKAGTVTEKYYAADENGNLVLKTTEIPACLGMMSSFNRIGAVWTGGSYNLINNIVREEWGFNGYIVTDFDNGTYMDTVQMLRAGGDAKLVFMTMAGYDGKNFELNSKTDNATYHYAREALHHVLYNSVNSSAVNGVVHGVSRTFVPYYYFIVAALDVMAVVGVGLLIWYMFRKGKTAKKESNFLES